MESINMESDLLERQLKACGFLKVLAQNAAYYFYDFCLLLNNHFNGLESDFSILIFLKGEFNLIDIF